VGAQDDFMGPDTRHLRLTELLALFLAMLCPQATSERAMQVVAKLEHLIIA
jgi:hypothetical protein